MKKMTLGLLVLGIAATAQANSTFTGWFAGAELHSTKHTFSVPNSVVYASGMGEISAKGSHKGGVGVIGGYGFELGSSDFIGQVEGKIRTGGSKTRLDHENISKEKLGASIAYLQGYRLNNVMPYLKASVNSSSFSTNAQALCASRCGITNQAGRGFGYGVGVKYAVNQNVELGAEYHRANLKGRNNIKLKTSTVSANAAYRF